MDIIEAWQNIDTSLKEAVANYLLTHADVHHKRRSVLLDSRVYLPDQIERTGLFTDALYAAARVVVSEPIPLGAASWEDVPQQRKELVYYHLLAMQSELTSLTGNMSVAGLYSAATRLKEQADACYFAAQLLGYQDPREVAKDKSAIAQKVMVMTAVWDEKGEIVMDWKEVGETDSTATENGDPPPEG